MFLEDLKWICGWGLGLIGVYLFCVFVLSPMVAALVEWVREGRED